MRRHLKVLGIVLMLQVFFVAPARADLLGTENAALWKLVGLKLKELAQVSQLISNGKLVISGVNEVASVARSAMRMYTTLRNYSLDDFVRDAKAGLTEAFPEIADLEREVQAMSANIGALEDDKFWRHRDHHDARARHFLETAARHAYRSALYPMVFKGAREGATDPTPVDLLVQEEMRRSGIAMKVARENSALAVLVKASTRIMEDAEAKKRTDLRGIALGAQAGIQVVRNTRQLIDIESMRVANEVAEQKRNAASNKAIANALFKHPEVLTRRMHIR